MVSNDFANIAVGDTVIICSRYGRELHKVVKVTNTQFAIESGTRFMRSDGAEYGGGGDIWRRKIAIIPTAKDIADVQSEQRQERAVAEAFRLRKQIETALNVRDNGREKGWAPSIEACNNHLRRALEALQTKQEDLL